ncbi:DUF6801 domain-containing protein [Streptomyces polyrhachis]|uniref:DUF6801 domain-containing protein n=1 Tax=Streptomyces polyrhachis TaxID=1282885 RepID=A0ABW2GET3_9ACTN
MRAARFAGIGALALLGGLLPGSNPAVGAGAGRIDVLFDCALADGSTVRTEAAIAVVLPESGTPGERIQPTDVEVAVEPPAATLAALAAQGTTSVDSTVTLGVDLRQGANAVKAPWGPLAAAASTTAAERPTHTGEVPWVLLAAEGEVSFTTADLQLTLTPKDGSSLAPVDVTCAPTGPGTLLGTVEVRAFGAPEASAPEDAPPATSGAGAAPGGESPGADGGEDATDGGPGVKTPESKPFVMPRQAAGVRRGEACPEEKPDTRPDPKLYPPMPPTAVLGSPGVSNNLCAIATGFATVRKQQRSMIVNDGRKNVMTALRLVFNQERYTDPRQPGWTRRMHSGTIALPDAESSFMVFDFQPASAKVAFEAGPVTAVSDQQSGTTGLTMHVGYFQHLRLYDVKINGVPLRVGPDCRTSKPIKTMLSGKYATTINNGGILTTGSLEIPPFSGCRNGTEDVSRLLTLAISGPGNKLKIRQGQAYRTGEPLGSAVPELPPL